MTITFHGNFPELPKVPTGINAIDWALGGGYPLRTVTEIYGTRGIGKTTFALWLSGRISSQLKSKAIAIAPFDNIEKDMVQNILKNSGFSGDVFLEIFKQHGYALDALIEKLRKGKISCGIVDTYSAVMSTAELEGKVDDTVMGRRAMLLHRYIRQANLALKLSKNPAFVIGTNHQRVNIGSIGMTTPGGEATKDHSQLRIHLKQIQALIYDDGWGIEGKIKKYNFGVENRVFKVFMIGGEGVNANLSSVVFCLANKKKTEVKLERGILYLGDTSYGRFSSMIDKRDDEDMFKPFVNMQNEILSANEDTGNESEETVDDLWE